ncbi:MAG: hypothetical protein GY944_09825 [bacterium]|nr:hypothetical protein [bacterium]
MEAAEKLAVLAAGVFFLNALICGVWKYAQIRSSSDARAHPYVDTAHRASFLYSFAALLLARFAELSNYPAALELAATALPLFFFALAIANYMVHGALRDTDNVFRSSRGAGGRGAADSAITAFMAALILAEVGGFLVLFYGFARAQLF